MSQDLIRFMHALFLPAVEGWREPLWRPAADIYRTRRGYLVKLDLAGVRPQDVTLTVQGDRMTVRGVRRDCTTEEGCSYYRMEIAYNQFERTLQLPCDLDQAQIGTEFRDGMLLVHVFPDDGK